MEEKGRRLEEKKGFAVRYPGMFLLCAMLFACGYKAGFGFKTQEIRSVSVKIVGNKTFRQRLEIPLTRSIEKELESYVHVRPSSSAKADAVLEVTIRSAGERPIAEGGEDVVSVGSLFLVVDAKLVRRVDGRILRKARVADRAEFIIAGGEGFEGAAKEAIGKIARRVVLLLDPEIDKLRFTR